MQKIVFGINYHWLIQDVLGRGDAGEVLSVLSEDKSITAVMKRPVQNGTGGSIMRQASQIENESRILARLEGIRIKQDEITVVAPRLLDTSSTASSQTVAYFMVSQQVCGKALSDIIKETHRDGSFLPHLWVLTIISALFTLLNEAHRKGILWNDVKADHIFWDAASKTLSCIDWGNGLLLDQTSEIGGLRPSPLTDYHQLIAEMTPVITIEASDLLWDLNWPLERVNELDEDQIRLLEKRVQYTRGYLVARIIEKRGLIGKLLTCLPDMESLQKLLSLADSLKKAGEKIDLEAINKSVSKLFMTYIHSGDIENCLQLVTNITEFHRPQIKLEWALLHELLIISKDQDFSLEQITRSIIDQDWSNALWELHRNAGRNPNNGKLERIIALIRQQAIPSEIGNELPSHLLMELSDELHMRLIQLRMSRNSSSTLEYLSQTSKKLDALLSNWQVPNEGSRFGQELLVLRGVLQSLKPLGIQVKPQLNQMVPAMLSLIRSIYQSWQAGEIAASRQLLRTLHVWDPHYDDLFGLDHNLQQMQDWLDLFMQGPNPSQTVPVFLQELLRDLPNVSIALGSTNWLDELIKGLHTAVDMRDLSVLFDISHGQGLPMQWLSDLEENILPATVNSDITLDVYQLEILNDFHQQLKSGGDTAEVCARIRQGIPTIFPFYKSLVHNLDAVLAPLIPNITLIDPAQAPVQDQAAVQKVIDLIQVLQDWRKSVEAHHYAEAAASLRAWQDWADVKDCSSSLILWRKNILPVLVSIKHGGTKAANLKAIDFQPQLGDLKNACVEMNLADTLWRTIDEKGFTPGLASEIKTHLATSEQSFHKLWQGLLYGRSKGLRILAQINQAELAGVYHLLQKLANQAVKAAQALELLSRSEMALTRLAFNSAGDLMYALTKMEEHFTPFNTASLVQSWHQQYIEFLKHTSRDAMQAQLALIDAQHPLFAWFTLLSSREFGLY